MNAVIYARYSSDSQREESIEGQLRECREYAERNNMTIVGTYIDRALSAKTADRPEFQHMIKDSAKELFEIVLVWKLDRFSRDRYDSAHYKHILKKNGVKVVSAKEHISEGPEGIILEAMLEGYAEFYSAELSEKIHRGQKENALKGKNNGGGVPLGYLLDKKAQKLVIDPVTAPLVVEIFEKYADGKSVRSIVEDFNARGLKTKRGQPFNINSFSSLLKNRKYIGEYRYQDVVIEGGVPAIVPEDLFNRVQERMEKNRHAPAMVKAKEDYLLTTKLFCGKCERMMVGESGKSHTGAMHYYYKCSGAKRLKDCDKKAVRKDWIERVVVRLIMQRVMDEEKINRLIDAILVMQEQEDTTIPALRSQLAETESSISMTCPFFNRSLTFWRVTSTSDTVLFRRSAFSSATHSKAEKSRRRRFVSYSSFPSAAYCSVASWRISALALSSSIGCCFRALSNASCVLGCVAGVELR